MRKKLLLTVLLFSLPQKVLASDFDLKIGGSIDTQYGIINQEKNFRYKEPGIEKDKVLQKGLVNNNSINLTASKKLDNGSEIGGYIKLNANTSKTNGGRTDIADQTYAYYEGNFGRLEIGATKSVNDTVRVSAHGLARATGGLDGNWSDWIKYGAISANKNGKDLGWLFLTGPFLPGDDFNSKANKLNYLTPKINGFTFGIGYVPDTTLKGTVNKMGDLYKIDCGYKNVIQPAIRFEKEVNDVKLTASIISEIGKSKDHDFGLGRIEKRKKLFSYAIGSGIEYNGFEIAAEYGNLGKSGTPKNTKPGYKYGASYWALGSAYTHDAFGISINYMESKKAGAAFGKKTNTEDNSLYDYLNEKHYNKFNALVLGADYKLAEGLMPYVEVTRFKYNRNKNGGKGNKGTLFLAGTKIKF